MGFAGLVRSVVGIADSVTKTLQANVTLYRWTGEGSQDSTFDSGISLPAIIEYKTRELKGATGKVSVQRAKVTILQPVPEMSGAPAARNGPIDPRDKVVLPDGTWGMILHVEGLIDPSTGSPYMYELSLGEMSNVS